MRQVQVELIDYTREPDRTVAVAARLCYSPSGISEISDKMDHSEVGRMVEMLRRRGHMSPFEHASFTVGIEGLSRAASHQLVRSRIASYSQQSQRYIEQRGFCYVVPPSIGKDDETRRLFEEHMDSVRDLYEQLREAGVPKEDARFVMPQATASSIVMTKNARAWLEWFEIRMCTRAQWEIRVLAHRVHRLLQSAAPNLFNIAGPTCQVEGLCREGDHSCGRIDNLTFDELPYRPAALRDEETE